jgi:hypothetical protein
MENTGGGILGRLGEKMLGWIALGLLIVLAIAIWRMDPVVRTAIWQGIWRTILWVVIAAALPWSARLFIRRILDVSSNWAGVGLLAAFVAVDLGVGLLMVSGCDTSIEAKRLAVASETADDATKGEPPLATAPPSADATGVLREKLAEVAEGAADVAQSAAEQLRGDEDGNVSPAEPDAAAAETEAAGDETDRGHSVWFWSACLAALALAGTYNYLVTEYLAEMSGA